MDGPRCTQIAAGYLIDRSGKIVYAHVGQSKYDETENAIRKVLDAGPAAGPEKGADLSKIGSPAMYFGLDRVAALASPAPAPLLTPIRPSSS